MIKKRSCSNCIMGINISINKDILCRDKGVVSPDYVCRRHKFAPVSKFDTNNVVNKCIDCEHFIIDSKSGDELIIGLCRLFSVRKYNGKERKACSKFTRQSKSKVS